MSKDNAADNNCKAKNYFDATKSEGCKKCSPCAKTKSADNKAEDCTLYAYRPNCCKGKAAHHVIPVRCFTPPGQRKAGTRYDHLESYNDKDAPCICLESDGADSQHKRIHRDFDATEQTAGENGDPPGTWSYKEASNCGAKTAANATDGKCSEKCIKAQLDVYHESLTNKKGCKVGKEGDQTITVETRLRADPSGKKDSSKLANLGSKSAIGPRRRH